MQVENSRENCLTALQHCNWPEWSRDLRTRVDHWLDFRVIITKLAPYGGQRSKTGMNRKIIDARSSRNVELTNS